MPSPAYRHRTRYRTTTRGKLKLENLNMIAKIITGDFLKGKKTSSPSELGLWVSLRTNTALSTSSTAWSSLSGSTGMIS